MNAKVYRILYCSHNRLNSSEYQQREEIARILASSRRNNSARGITGALLFNSGYFAQVLEGPLTHVEQTFETIQRDMRHDDVTVLECGFVEARDFPEWSMAFVGSAPEDLKAFAGLSLSQALAQPSTAADEVSKLLRRLVVQEEDYASI